MGKTDLKISCIGFGCMSLSKASRDAAFEMIRHAYECGINYYDTADLYDKGDNERLLGIAVHSYREKILIATKVGNEWRKDGIGWDWNPRKDYILKAVDASLKRLNTDYIDLYQLHGGTTDDNIEEIIGAFEELVKRGKIRYYGISSIRPNVIRKYVSQSDIQSVMMQYSMLDRRPEEKILDLLGSQKISVMARGVLAQGLLVNKPPKDYLEKDSQQIDELKKIISNTAGDKYSTTAIALQYVLNNPTVCTAVLGFSTLSQIDEIIAAEREAIPLAILKDLALKITPNYYSQHR